MTWLIILLLLALVFLTFFISEPLRIRAERSGNTELARGIPAIVSACVVIGLIILLVAWLW